VLFLFKCGLASEVGLRHLSWNNSGGSATLRTFSPPSVRSILRYASRNPIGKCFHEAPRGSMVPIGLTMDVV
jgi:hypothetical protein